jgi:folate-binding protein YgfZ
MTSTVPASPLLGLPGAVDGEGVDAGVAWHYGDPLREQRDLTDRVAFVDRSHREVIALPGEDRLSWLHTVTSQHLTGLAESAGAQALVLDPHGRIEHHLQLANVDGTVWIDVEAGQAAPLLDYLQRMRFMSRVEPTDASATMAVLSVAGPVTDATLAAAGLPVPGPQAYDVASADGVIARRMSWPVAGAVDLLVPRDRLAAIAAALQDAGATPAGSWAWEALRVEAGQPRQGLETDHRSIPHELGWIGVKGSPDAPVHLDKGCYRGQETVARVHNLGRPPRLLALLHLDGVDALPAHGDEVLAGERVVGTVGSVARHWELGPVALAVLRRQAVEDADVRSELTVRTADGIVAAAAEPVAVHVGRS